jgi:hypothetical protein
MQGAVTDMSTLGGFHVRIRHIRREEAVVVRDERIEEKGPLIAEEELVLREKAGAAVKEPLLFEPERLNIAPSVEHRKRIAVF